MEFFKNLTIALTMIFMVILTYIAYTLTAVTIMNAVFPIDFGTGGKKEPIVYCGYLESGPDDKACTAFGGIKKVRWERDCVPDPNCMQFPDGTSYVEKIRSTSG